MALLGDLTTLSLPDLLYIFGLRRMTGRLSLETDDDDASLYFHRGRLVHVASSRVGNQLGQLLVQAGKLNLEQLGIALALQATSLAGRGLGEILLQQGWITPDDLNAALSQQAEEILYRVLTWQRGSFTFSPFETSRLQMPLRDFNIEQIILEATRRADELVAIRSLVPSLDCGVVLLRDPSTAPFTDSLRLKTRIVVASIQQGAVTLRQVARATGLSDEEVSRIAYELAKCGALAIGRPPSGAAAGLTSLASGDTGHPAAESIAFSSAAD
jgi:hypothetical protein